MNEVLRKYAGILYYIGYMSVIGSFLFLPSLMICVFAKNPDYTNIMAFWIPSLSLLFLGLLLRVVFSKYKNEEINLYSGAVLTVFGWIWIILISALPFSIGMKLPFHLAFFESMSGWTTTGLSIINVSETTQAYLLWRSIMQFAGGAGLAIIMLSAFGIQSGCGSSIMEAEGRSDKMIPNVVSSATMVMRLYVMYAAGGIFFLRLAGMNFFDGITHTFAAISTGGFANYPESIGFWDSWLIYFTILVLMFLGSLNFITAYEVFHGRIRALFKNSEVRLFAGMVFLSSFSLFFFMNKNNALPLAYRLKVALFESVSGLTTTGFNIHDYGKFNEISLAIIILLMIVGGGAYSTSGGIKQIRIIVVLKELFYHVKQQLLPKNTVQSRGVYYGRGVQWMNGSMVHKIFAFVFMYLFLLSLGTLIIMTAGYSFLDSFFEFASSLGTVGLSVGITAADAPAYVLWTQIVGMFLGRLEIFVVLIGVSKIYSDIRKYKHYNLKKVTDN